MFGGFKEKTYLCNRYSEMKQPSALSEVQNKTKIFEFMTTDNHSIKSN